MFERCRCRTPTTNKTVTHIRSARSHKVKSGSDRVAIIAATLERRMVKKISIQTPAVKSATNGANPSKTPAAVATPFPPRNSKYAGQQ